MTGRSEVGQSRLSVLMGVLVGVMRVDVTRVLRDRFILGLVAYLLGIAVAMRWAVPWVTVELDARIAFDFVPYQALLVSHVVAQLSPMVVGMLVGFLLLETKESGALLALRTTPLGAGRYLRWLIVGMALASATLCMFEAAVIGVAAPDLGIVFISGLIGTPSAVLTAYIIGGLSDTKTEAFANSKLTALLPLIPSGAWFVAKPWRYLFGIDPAFWSSQLWWSAFAGEGAWVWQAAAGLFSSGLATWALYRLFLRRLER